MHIKNGYYQNLEQLRQKQREVRILFSGNTDPLAYKNSIISKRFKKLNPIAVLDILIKNLSPERLIAINGKGDINNIPQLYFNGALFYLWQWSPSYSQALDIRVENDQWHEFLAKGDFFLCCPGAVIPQCHNAIEAISVGAIPILQYPELFHPRLKHGINCLTYNNEKDLISNINLCFEMPESEIARLRKGVIDYYEAYLRHDAPYRIITSLPDGFHNLYFYNEAV